VKRGLFFFTDGFGGKQSKRKIPTSFLRDTRLARNCKTFRRFRCSVFVKVDVPPSTVFFAEISPTLTGIYCSTPEPDRSATVQSCEITTTTTTTTTIHQVADGQDPRPEGHDDLIIYTHTYVPPACPDPPSRFRVR